VTGFKGWGSAKGLTGKDLEEVKEAQEVKDMISWELSVKLVEKFERWHV
jgi:hypothetical protein